ncbi:MAG: PD-(D/E)XK nuclease family protein, partial [Alphaproteobacteria bacterium]|nr:PD-(D/E)XK nuclease family protein [Alphaproteobacteria bacterium]
MKRKANIFCASNPAKLADALWAILPFGDLSNLVIFLPSRRAVRTVERMIADKKGGAAILPKLVALGEANDEECDDPSADAAKANTPGTVSNLERTIVLSKMLSAANGFGIGANITVAKDLIRMTDYLENEKTENKRIEWQSLVDDKYAEHFREKAKFFDLAQNALPLVFTGRETVAERRNKDIRSWIGALEAYDKVIVCGSTASVPATADLMKYIAWLDNGYIILPGDVRHKITAHNACDPYDAELKFLESVSVRPADVRLINVGESAIGFLNGAFDNPMSFRNDAEFVRIDCAREAEEAEVVAEIATEKSAAGKSVLIVSPDISAAQRLSESLLCRGASFDFSGGTKGGSTQVGRFILNLLDGDNDFGFHNEYKKSGLFDAVVKVAEEFTDEESITVIEAVRDLSDILSANGLELSPGDLRAAIAECLNGVSIRGPRNEGALISIVGTIESRMQTADVVILAGLNEGMFPATGYENPWLPRRAAEAIGLPAPERKVSLMALDFINLSCGPEVYWTRSKMSGGADTTESRFLSRVSVAEKCAVCSVQCEVDDKDGNLNAGEGDTITAHCTLHTAHYWLNKVRALDNIPYEPLDASPPRPPSTNDDVYVTGLELLIHNPYAFYARHILKLRLKDDPEREADARDFGILAHEAIERLATNN